MTKIDVEKFRVVGIAVRTSQRIESSTKRRIPGLWKRFLEENILQKIPNKVEPQKIYALYTEYDSDDLGKYTYIIGSEVSEFINIPEGMIGKTVQANNYEMIQSENGPFEEVVPKVWKTARSDADLKEQRSYRTDFVCYEAENEETKGKAQLYLGIA